METESCDRKDTEDIDTGHESCDRKDIEDIDTGHEAHNKSRLTSEKYKKDKRIILGIIELKIVLSGKTGVGKSFLGNHLLTKQLFESRVDFGSITSECSSGSRTLHDGTIIRVFDTPGFFDTRYERAELVKHMFSLSSLTAPGPHVFIYVLRADEKFTEENKDSINLFRDIFGNEVNKYVIFVLNRKPKETDAEKLIDRCEVLKTILKECHDRYVTINFADGDTGVEKCIDNLLQMIRNTIRGNDQKHYSSDVFVDAERSYNEKQEFKKKQEGMELKLADKDKQINEKEKQINENEKQINELKQQLFDQKKAETGSIKKECGPMRERDYDKVRKFFQVILTNVTNPLDLCIALFSSGVFNADDTYEIEKIENRKKQCYKLLMKVLNDCGPNTFPKFLDALTSTGHQHTRDLLDAEEGHFVATICLPKANFHPDYSNHNSDKFRDLKKGLTNAIVKELEKHGLGEISSELVDIRKGSTKVTFVFTTYSKTDCKNLQPILEQILESGYIGPFKVSRENFSFYPIEDWQWIHVPRQEDILCQNGEQRLWNRLHRANVDGNILEYIKTISPADGESAIMMASVAGWYDVVIYLLEHLVYSKEYQTNLLSIVLDNYRTQTNSSTNVLQCVGKLVNTGVVLNKSGVANERPLLIAAKKGLLEVVTYLLDHGAEIQCVDAEGHNILHLLLQAIDGTGKDETECIHVVEKLLDHDLDVNQQNETGNTPLFYIACLANREDVSLSFIHYLTSALISKACDVNHQNNEGLTPLMYFIIQQVNVHILRLLITNYANVELCDSHGNTAYTYCIQYRKHDCNRVFELLAMVGPCLSAGVCITLLHQILEYGRLRVFNYCMRLKTLFKGVTDEGENMLHLLAKVNYDYSQPTFKWLLNIDVDINQQCSKTNTPTMIASLLLNSKYLEVITHHPNIEINSQNNKGHTALHLCIIGFATLKKGLNKRYLKDAVHEHCGQIYPIYLECMKSLLRTSNIDVNIQDKGGRTALMMAAMKNDRHITRLLLEAGAKVNKLDHAGRSALQYLNIYKSNFDMACFRLLLSSDDLDILDLPCIDGNTILQTALLFPVSWEPLDVVAFIRFLVGKNCCMQRLLAKHGESNWNLIDRFEGVKRQQLRRLLYYSGAPKDQIISTLNFMKNYDEDGGTFYNFCNNLSLTALCRRIIRKKLGLEIESKVRKLGLPNTFNQFVLLKDCLHPREYRIDFAFSECSDHDSFDFDDDFYDFDNEFDTDFYDGFYDIYDDYDYDSYDFDYEYDVYDDVGVLKEASVPSLQTQCKEMIRGVFTNEDIDNLTMLSPLLKKFLIFEDPPMRTLII